MKDTTKRANHLDARIPEAAEGQRPKQPWSTPIMQILDMTATESGVGGSVEELAINKTGS